MKTSKKDYEIFKKEFLRWAKKLELGRWEIRFEFELLEDDFAICKTSMIDMVAWVSFTTEHNGNLNPKMSGKHEALELLLSSLDENARYRYVSESEIDESRHTVIRLLEKIL